MYIRFCDSIWKNSNWLQNYVIMVENLHVLPFFNFCSMFSLSPFHREALKRGGGMKFLLRNSEKTNWDICLTQTRCVSVRNSMCVSFKRCRGARSQPYSGKDIWLTLVVAVLQCCSSHEAFPPYPKNTSIFIYILYI